MRRPASTIREALHSAVTALTAAGVPTPRLDAEVMLAAVLGVDRTALMLDPDGRVPGPEARRFEGAWRRRGEDREPVAYILQSKGFRHLDLHVDPRVLIPRPETELLVEVGLLLPAGVRVHDLGTGSGAIALALADERPDLVVSGSDCSRDAVDVAQGNAGRLGLNARFGIGGWEIVADTGRPIDAVLVNPPYVAESERAALAPELRHEPPGALFAGADGLDALREITALAGERLRSGRPFLIALEVGYGQAQTVQGLLARAGAQDTAIRCDLAGIERVVLGWRS